MRVILTGGEAHDVTAAPDLLDGQTAGGVIADKAYDNNEIREMIAEANIKVVISSKQNRKIQIPHDVKTYKLRNRRERFFNKTQTLPQGRNPLRPKSRAFPRNFSTRLKYDLGALNVDPT